jgi:hypothetical protein
MALRFTGDPDSTRFAIKVRRIDPELFLANQAFVSGLLTM